MTITNDLATLAGSANNFNSNITAANNGNIGIGNTASTYKLTVQDNGNINSTVAVRNTTAGTSSLARFLATSDGGSAIFGFTSSSYTDITGAADALLLNTSSSSGGMVFAQEGVSQMKIDASGRVTMPYQTGFHAQYGSIASQSWSGTAAYQAVQLNGQATFGSRVTGYNTSTYRFTAPVAGMYMLYSRFTPTTNSQTGPEAIFSINGSGAYYAGINYAAAGVGSYVSTSGNLLVQLAANDWVEFRIINNNNVSFTLDLTRCAFGGYLVG